MTDGGSSPIAAVEAVALSVPLARPIAFATRRVDHREYVLVRVRTDDGSEGTGYTYAGNQGGQLVADAVHQLVAPLVRGRSSWALRENWDLIYQELLLIGRRGLVLRALSAFDLAGWDLLGKQRGRSLAQMLGCTSLRAPAYASGGYYYADSDPLVEIEREVAHHLELGFRDFKVKFGRLNLEEDLARVRLAREMIGPGGRLALDLNNRWASLAEALPALDALAELGIWWVEEPFAPDDIESHVQLAGRSAIPIATGELEATRWAFADLIRRGAAHVLQPDACVLGGVSEWLDVARTAEAFVLPVAPHWHANIHAPLVAASRNGLTVEYFDHTMGVFNFQRLVANPLEVRDGALVLQELPGLGVVFDDVAVQRWSLT